jgi:hypothetical protein
MKKLILYVTTRLPIEPVNRRPGKPKRVACDLFWPGRGDPAGPAKVSLSTGATPARVLSGKWRVAPTKAGAMKRC